jgi:2-polyprenyl-6-methoxyphenol hydroxylase-like FAD-dependent oxidoreductase
MSAAIAGGQGAGPLMSFLNNETEAATPVTEGGVLIGDAGGWTDPLIGCGLSSAYSDARGVCEILLGGNDRSPDAFAPYVQERAGRLRRLRFISEMGTALQCDFSERGRGRRDQFNRRSATDPTLLSHVIANLAGPNAQPAEVFTPEHRAFVLGEA